MLEFPAQELRKYFKMGDHVKVIAGRFEGDTGLIVRVEENFVILFSDLTMHEVSGGVEGHSLAQRDAGGKERKGGNWSWQLRFIPSSCPTTSSRFCHGTCSSARRRRRVWMWGDSMNGVNWCSWTPRQWVLLYDWSVRPSR